MGDVLPKLPFFPALHCSNAVEMHMRSFFDEMLEHVASHHQFLITFIVRYLPSFTLADFTALSLVCCSEEKCSWRALHNWRFIMNISLAHQLKSSVKSIMERHVSAVALS